MYAPGPESDPSVAASVLIRSLQPMAESLTRITERDYQR